MTDSSKDSVKKFQTPGRVKVIDGSILAPHNAGLRFVLSITNTAGKPESPMYPLFEKKWKKVKEEAKGWWSNKTGKYVLGAVNTTSTQSDTWVIHMLVQDDDLKTSVPAVETCLKEICKMAIYEKATIHVSNVLTSFIPELQDLLTKHLVENGVSVNYYNEPANK